MQIQVSYALFAIPTILTKTSVCTDPILYFWLNSQFRRALLKTTGLGGDASSQTHNGISLTSLHTKSKLYVHKTMIRI